MNKTDKLFNEVIDLGKMKGIMIALSCLENQEAKKEEIQAFLLNLVFEYVSDESIPEENRSAVLDTMKDIGILKVEDTNNDDNDN